MNEFVKRLMDLSAPQVADALKAVDLSDVPLDGIFALEPVKKIAGRAFTVSYGWYPDAETERNEYIEKSSPGDILMLANNGYMKASVWGGQRSLSAIANKAGGTVVDGVYRDVEEHQQLGYPVYGRGRTIVGSKGHVVPVAVEQVVKMGGVRVAPGDYVVGDASGVVVIPQDRIGEVLDKAEAIAERERLADAASGH